MSVGREGRGKLEDDRPVAGSCQSNYLFVADGDGQHGSTVLVSRRSLGGQTVGRRVMCLQSGIEQ